MDDWDDVWEQWNDEDCCDSAEDSGNFEFDFRRRRKSRDDTSSKRQSRHSGISRDNLTGSSKDEKRPRKIYS